MYEGKPLVLVIGGSDTGRTPMAAALLRRALGADVVVRTAGVLSHEGEGAMPEAQMALEQIGLDISRHISRPLRHEEHRNAELLLAVDRGTELVLFAEFAQDPRVTCLPVLADMPDVLDPHRMPLGVWVAALRQLSDQVSAAAPQIRSLLGLPDQPPALPQQQVERRHSWTGPDPLVLGTGHKMQWDRDEDMQRLLQLINGQLSAETAAATLSDGDAAEQARDGTTDDEHSLKESNTTLPAPPDAPDAVVRRIEPATAAPPQVGGQPQQFSAGDRSGHIARMVTVLHTAEEMPEIIDWSRLREELVRHLRALAELATGAMDFTPAATLMIEGKLAQVTAQPGADVAWLLARSIKHLDTPVNGALLATIGSELAEW